MPKGLQPIYTQTVTATTGVTVNFTNIPQNYTDLLLVGSIRFTSLGGDNYLTFNNSSTLGSGTYLQGADGGPYTGRINPTDGVFIGQTNGSNDVASTFSNIEVYIPNYASNIFKSTISTSFRENNNNTSYTVMPGAGLWRSNAPIRSMFLYSLAQHSSLTLYGISR